MVCGPTAQNHLVWGPTARQKGRPGTIPAASQTCPGQDYHCTMGKPSAPRCDDILAAWWRFETFSVAALPSLLHLQLLALAAAVTGTHDPRRHGPQTQRTFFGNAQRVRELPYGTPSSRCIEAVVVVVVVVGGSSSRSSDQSRRLCGSSSGSSGGDVVGPGSAVAKSQQQHPWKPTAAVKKRCRSRSPQVPRDRP